MLLPHFMMGQSAIGLDQVTLETGRNITSATGAAATIAWGWSIWVRDVVFYTSAIEVSSFSPSE